MRKYNKALVSSGYSCSARIGTRKRKSYGAIGGPTSQPHSLFSTRLETSSSFPIRISAWLIRAMQTPASSLKQNFRKAGRPSNSRSNSMLSGRSMSRENGNSSSGGGRRVIDTIEEHTTEFTSLLARPLHNSDGEYLWEDRRPYVKWPASFFLKTYETLTSNPVNVLLVFVPLGIISGAVGWSPMATFILNFLAIIPLASLLSFATEELSVKLGQTLGGLLNASFGNAVELIVRAPRSS